MALDLDIDKTIIRDDFLDQLIAENINQITHGEKIPKSMKTGKELAFFEPIQKITPKHHNVARLVAEGLKDTQIAALTGYTAVRVYQLKADPLVSELIAFYCAEVGAKFADTVEKRKRVGQLALDRLEEKLLDDEVGPSLSAKSLTEIAEFALNVPIIPNVNGSGGAVNVNITFGKDQSQNHNQSDSSNSDRIIELEANK